MYSILVVDDFDLDRQNIIEAVESMGDLPLCVCGECENGYEALEAVHNLRPDILLLDVEMPGMNGIELADTLRREGSDIRIVFCSLYDKSHYLRSAISLRSEGYLMKPINGEDMRRCFEEMLVRMTDVEEQKRLFEGLRQAMQENRISLRRELFSDVLLGGDMPGINFEHRLRQLGLGEVAGFRVALVDVNANSPVMAQVDQDDEGLIPYRVYGYLAARSHERTPYYLVRISERRFALVLCFGADVPAEETHRMAEEVLKDLAGHMRQSFISLSATFGDQVTTPRELKGQYQLCRYRLNHRWKYSADEVIFAGEQSETANDPGPDMQGIETDLRMLLEMENEDIYVAADEYAGALLGRMPAGEMRLACHYVVGQIDLALQEGGSSLKTLAREMDAPVMEDLLSLERQEDCRRFCRDLIVAAYSALRRRDAAGGKDLMEQIRRYIREGDLKTVQLHSVAQRFSYSPNYLNHVFKTATGVTILEYITSCRIARAKELMESTGMNLAEIAEEVGYSHATYLSIVFKKQEGITPKQYMGRHRQ